LTLFCPFACFCFVGFLGVCCVQAQRDTTLANFKAGKFRVLVATDVAARGIDVSGVDLVLQFQLPQNSDAYVHRAGRTGRAGKTGVSIVLHTSREERGLRNLEFQIGDNFKFERHAAPTPAKVMAAAAAASVTALEGVDDAVLPFFASAAAEALEGCGGDSDEVGLLAWLRVCD
jgi:ATP-dependent RNA helicase DDX21